MIFIWGAVIFFKERTPPRGATEVYVVAKQWMWKLQHEEGQREINELHVPVGRDVKLILTSQDVIHSFYVPAFRIKQDVLPGVRDRTQNSAPLDGMRGNEAVAYAGRGLRMEALLGGVRLPHSLPHDRRRQCLL